MIYSCGLLLAFVAIQVASVAGDCDNCPEATGLYCFKGKCTRDPSGWYCFKGKCTRDACNGACVWNANCRVDDDVATCECIAPMLYGDATKECTDVPDGCFEENIEYGGSFVANRRTGSARWCQKLCKQEPQCAFWTYDPKHIMFEQPWCTMQTKEQREKATSSIWGSKRYEKEGFVSGPRECAIKCETSETCPSGWACYQGECNRDPCDGSCAYNAQCEIKEETDFMGHPVQTPTCVCAMEPYVYGDPKTECHGPKTATSCHPKGCCDEHICHAGWVCDGQNLCQSPDRATFACGKHTCKVATQYCPLIKNKCLTKRGPSYCTRHVQCLSNKCVWTLKKFSFQCAPVST